MKDFNNTARHSEYFSDLYQRIDAAGHTLNYDCRSMGATYPDVHKDLKHALDRLEEEVAQKEASGAKSDDFKNAEAAISELETAVENYKGLLATRAKFNTPKAVYPKMIP